MSAMPQLDVRRAQWDRFRGAVVMPCGVDQVAVTLEALESWMNRRLSPCEAVEAAIEEKAVLRTVANATPAHDNVIMITTGILNSRSWSAEPYEGELE